MLEWKNVFLITQMFADKTIERNLEKLIWTTFIMQKIEMCNLNQRECLNESVNQITKQSVEFNEDQIVFRTFSVEKF